MTAIGPGDWVLCVTDEWEGDDGAGFVSDVPEPGALYRVENVVTFQDGTAGLELYGFSAVADGWRDAFPLECFRPIYPGGALIKVLMEPLPDALAATTPGRVSEPETA